jgi:hypothetical protein
LTGEVAGACHFYNVVVGFRNIQLRLHGHGVAFVDRAASGEGDGCAFDIAAGPTPTSPPTVVAPLFVTVEPARTPNVSADPRLGFCAAAGVGVAAMATTRLATTTGAPPRIRIRAPPNVVCLMKSTCGK